MKMTLSAQRYCVGLLKKQALDAEIRVFITDVATSYAKCGMCFCFPNSFQVSDVIVEFDCVSVRIEESIVPFLRDAVVDLITVDLDNQLTFKAPYARGLVPIDGSFVDAQKEKNNLSVEFSLKEKITDILDVQINPQLAMHGGSVLLVDVTKDFLVVLRFSGGCNGCSMANYTMKLGIERTLKKIFPQIQGVCDVTEHSRGSHSYF